VVRNTTIRIGVALAIVVILCTVAIADPLLPNRPPTASYWDRIHEAVRAGILSEEQALIYGVTALFAPERLPCPFALGQRGKCGTPVLTEAEARWATLPDWARAALAQWPVAAGYRGLTRADTRPSLSGPEQTLATAHFVLHYTLSGTDAVDATDADANGVPDYVDSVAQAMEHARLVQVETLGWLEPPADANTDPGSPLYDVYIAYLSVDGLTFPEEIKGDNEHSPGIVEPFARTSYIALHNRLSLPVLQVTAAHEYQHAIQFGYNAAAEGFDSRRWLMEGTATWMEDQVYDDIDDNVGYLPRLFAAPDRSLADPQNYYASWIFFQYLEEHAGGTEVMREIWERGVPIEGDFSVAVIRSALQSRGYDLGDTFVNFCSANALLAPCELAPGPWCYADALLYRDRAGRAAVEGVVSITSGEFPYVPPDGVQQLACDYVRVSAQADRAAASGYSGQADEDLAATWLGHSGLVIEALPIPMRHNPIPPEAAVNPSRYGELYIVIANVGDPTGAPLVSAPYGLILLGSSATETPSPTPTASPAPSPTASATPTPTATPSPTSTLTPSATPTPTTTPIAARRLWLPIVAAE